MLTPAFLFTSLLLFPAQIELLGYSDVCLDAWFNSTCFKYVPFLNKCVSCHSIYAYCSTAPKYNPIYR